MKLMLVLVDGYIPVYVCSHPRATVPLAKTVLVQTHSKDSDTDNLKDKKFSIPLFSFSFLLNKWSDKR